MWDEFEGPNLTPEEAVDYLERQRLAFEDLRKEYEYFRRTLKDADTNGLGFEFFEDFIINIKNGEAVTHACWGAAYNWDF